MTAVALESLPIDAGAVPAPPAPVVRSARPALRIVTTEAPRAAVAVVEQPVASRTVPVQPELPLRWASDRSGAGGSLRMARTAPLPLRAGLPRPEPYVAQATALVCEVLTGMRAPGQLQRWATLEVEQQLARRAALLPVAPRGVARPRAVVLSTHPMAVAPDALMVSVVFRHNGRARAAGMRFDARHGRWIVTEVQVAP